MLSTRTTARGLLLLLALFGLAVGSAAARPSPEPHPPRAKPPKPPRNQIVFPVLGQASYVDDFGDPRSQGPHEGNDIMAPRHALALAAEAGRVRFHTGSWTAGCMLYLDGRSGTTYLYIHLNNDLTQRNDNRGGCVEGVAFAPGLRSGDRVKAGQPVGFVGDSGDANGIHPHLHFELHPGGGRARDPYPYLRAARRLLFYAPAGTVVSLTLSGKVIAASDESLRLRVSTLRASPGALKLQQLTRKLTLVVPATALVERGRGSDVTPARLAAAKPGESVSVWTEPETVTNDAQAGKDGAISAERVLLPPR